MKKLVYLENGVVIVIEAETDVIEDGGIKT